MAKQDLLAATQVGLVYLIMRVVDGALRDLDWDREVVMAQTVCSPQFPLLRTTFADCPRRFASSSLKFVAAASANPMMTLGARVGQIGFLPSPEEGEVAIFIIEQSALLSMQ